MPTTMSQTPRPHINSDGEFQSDKYPTCPAGKVPLSVRDVTAQDLLWRYAQRRRAVDAEFAEDLETCLLAKGYTPVSDLLPARTEKLRNEIAGILDHGYAQLTGDKPVVSPSRAQDIDALLELMELGEPHLGCATTMQLLQEIKTRIEMHWQPSSAIVARDKFIASRHVVQQLMNKAVEEGQANYRTIDENSAPAAGAGEAANRTPVTPVTTGPLEGHTTDELFDVILARAEFSNVGDLLGALRRRAEALAARDH